MEASADENARINNKSLSDRNIEGGFNTLGFVGAKKSDNNSFKNTTSHHTHASKISNNTLL